MNKSYGNHRKIYVDYPKGNSKPTCLTHGPGHSSDECKVLGDFGFKYIKFRPTKYCRHDTVNRNKFNRQKYNNSIVNSTVDEIILNENEKIIVEKGAHENIKYDFD